MLISKKNNLPDIFSNYKIFFTENLDITIIDVNVKSKVMFFDDIEPVTNNVPKYNFTKEEKEMLTNIFYQQSDYLSSKIAKQLDSAQRLDITFKMSNKKAKQLVKNMNMIFPPPQPST